MVSIIIPVWGSYKQYLDDCLESVYKQTYTDYEIIVIDDETDLPTARNKGIKRAKGDWIVILDVDNQMTPDYLEKTVYKGDIVATHLQYFGDNEGQFIPISRPSIELFQYGNQIDANAGFKKRVWERVGGYDEEMKEGWEDYDFWYRCLKAGYEIDVISEPLILYRKHTESMSVTAGRKSQELRNNIINK